MSDNSETYRNIGKATGLIIVITLIDKLLALVKEIIVADRFGISPDLDVFNIALALPGLFTLLLAGAITSALVPLYAEWSTRFSPDQANQHTRSILYVTTFFFGLTAMAIWFLSPVIFPLMGYGFADTQKALGVVIERMLGFMILLEGTCIVFMSVLQAQKRFFYLQTAPFFINIITIGLLLFFHRTLGIYTLVWGLLAGTLCKMVYMGAALKRNGFKFFAPQRIDYTKVKMFALLVLPLLGSELIANVNLFIDQIMATKLVPGSVSTLRYAYRINDMPVQIVILSITIAIFPYISDHAARKEYDVLRDIFSKGVILLGLLTLPIICGVLLFSQDVVIILLKRGAFDLTAAIKTSETLLFYTAGLFFLSYTYINGAFFAAIQDTKPLLYMGFLTVFLNISFNLVFMWLFGVKGIALSTTFTLMIVAIIFMTLLKRRLKITFERIFANFWRILTAAATMFMLGKIFKWYFIAHAIDRLIYVPVTVVIITIFYFIVCWLLRTQELVFYLNIFKKKL